MKIGFADHDGQTKWCGVSNRHGKLPLTVQYESMASPSSHCRV